jgi:aryl-alcohol dehydrogenase-like predicted oxidoreductase
MTLDAYVTLGRSGLRVSPLCLGAMTFGEDHGWGASVSESEAMLAAYLERGGNFIDTANIYTNGHSEKIIGDFLARQPGRRDRLVLSTKFFATLFPGDPNGGGGGRKSLIAACDDSLRRLATDYIDLYWLHNWDRGAPIEETLRALDDLVTAGKIRYVGLSDLPAWKVAQAHTIAAFRGWAPAIAIQVEYSLLERTVEGEHIAMAQELGLGVMPWGPLKGGWLSGKITRGAPPSTEGRAAMVGSPGPRELDVIEAVGAIAHELGVSHAAVALAWVRGQPGVTSTLIGARRVDQLRDNLSALDVRLSPAQRARLDQISKPTLNFPAGNNAQLGPRLGFGGTTVDGVRYEALPLLDNPARY